MHHRVIKLNILLLSLIISILFSFSYANDNDSYDNEKTALIDAKKGNASAQFYLAQYYLASNEQRYADIFPLFNLNAQSKIDRDHESGLKWLKEAAKNGSSQAMYKLADLYDPDYSGDKFKTNTERTKNMKKAIYWYTESAARQNKDALFRLGEKYSKDVDPVTRESLGCSALLKQKKKAFMYYKNSETNDFWAGDVAYELANLYINYGYEEDCKINVNKALEYFALSIKYDSYKKNKAALYLGNYSFKHKSFHEALNNYLIYLKSNNNLYNKDDIREFLTVEFKVAYMYENGLGAKRNYPEAILYYTNAANSGLIEAQQNLNMLKNRIGSFSPS